MSASTIAVIPGDGIGPEVTAVACDLLDQVARMHDLSLSFTTYDFGAERYLRTGTVLTTEDVASLSAHDAILFGACGDPRVAPGVLELGLIVALRLAFDQFVNVRPVRLFPGVVTPFAALTPEQVDLVVLRENTEGLYTGGGGATHVGGPDEVATQISVSTRRGTERLVRYSFEQSMARRRHLTLVHKTNILSFAGSLWQRTVDELATDFPDVEVDYIHVDAMMLHLMQTPQRFDVVVTDNLFGDIVSDLGAVLQGGLGNAPSACISASGPSSFEPVHGSAPDIAGRGLASPVAAVLSAAMMLEHLGHSAASASLAQAVQAALVRRGGDTWTTSQMAEEIGTALPGGTTAPWRK